jgi:NAD(P)-dependent dehydrogenase (short-subunit alcohol dehydrogenase family)
VSRTYVVTGCASGIGQATAELLAECGHRVIGVDLRDADIRVDLATEAGRSELVTATAALSGGGIDAIVAVAGVAVMGPLAVAVNYFGALATLQGLRPLLAGSPAPRAVAVSSAATVKPVDDALMALLAAEDEPAALARAAELAQSDDSRHVYASSKRALSFWIRRNAPGPGWAGAGIPLNAIAPGVILTPMTAGMIAKPEGRADLEAGTPMPLNGYAEAIVPARLLAWLASEENSHLCGQTIFIDGGTDAVVRADTTW